MDSRKLYLIRHGAPLYPQEGSWCIGQTDLPLAPLGKMQAVLLAADLSSEAPKEIYASPLSRARETASLLACGQKIQIVPDLVERGMGEWDGLSFAQIRLQWPDIYDRRGTDPDFPVPGAESTASALKRFQIAMQRIMMSSEGNVAVVAHTDVISSFVSAYAAAAGRKPGQRRQYRLPCGGYYIFTLPRSENTASCTAILRKGSAQLSVMSSDLVKHQPLPELTERLCRALRSAAALPEGIAAHCDAVASTAMRLCDRLAERGYGFDRKLIQCSAMLHDIARQQSHHAEVGAGWLTDLGYPDVGRLIAAHHDLPALCLDEAAILFIADKITQGITEVSLEQRFSDSQRKCMSLEAQQAHRRRRAQAFWVRERINALCGREVIRAD